MNERKKESNDHGGGGEEGKRGRGKADEDTVEAPRGGKERSRSLTPVYKTVGRGRK